MTTSNLRKPAFFSKLDRKPFWELRGDRRALRILRLPRRFKKSDRYRPSPSTALEVEDARLGELGNVVDDKAYGGAWSAAGGLQPVQGTAAAQHRLRNAPPDGLRVRRASLPALHPPRTVTFTSMMRRLAGPPSEWPIDPPYATREHMLGSGSRTRRQLYGRLDQPRPGRDAALAIDDTSLGANESFLNCALGNIVTYCPKVTQEMPHGPGRH